LASRRRPDLGPLSPPVQEGLLRERYPAGRAVRTQRGLTWVGTITPTEASASYELLLNHQPPRAPLIYVVRPGLELSPGQAKLPHVYSLNTLCLYLDDREWNTSHPLADLIGWASEWLFFYEVWLSPASGSVAESTSTFRPTGQNAAGSHGGVAARPTTAPVRPAGDRPAPRIPLEPRCR
jgi:hypothetical protein